MTDSHGTILAAWAFPRFFKQVIEYDASLAGAAEAPPCEGDLHLETPAKQLKSLELMLAQFFEMRFEILG